MTAPSDLLALGLQHHRAGDLVQAEVFYRRLLDAEPASADAWHLLGVIATHRGQPEIAVGLIERGLAQRPDDAGFLLNLGVAQQALGRAADATESFRKAVERKPDFAEAHNNLANVLHLQGKTDEAVGHWRRALELRPDYAEAHQNLAGVLLERRDHIPPAYGPPPRVFNPAEIPNDLWISDWWITRQFRRFGRRGGRIIIIQNPPGRNSPAIPPIGPGIEIPLGPAPKPPQPPQPPR
jgi:tetratricopeptide (TPR) repeat protein